MRHVKDNGNSKFTHDWKRAHIHNEIVVAKADSSLRQEDFFATCSACFVDDVSRIARSEELALLHVDCSTGSRRFQDQICLSREKCRNLKYVCNFGYRADLDGQLIAATRLAVFGDGDEVRVEASPSGVRFLLISGKPLGEPIARYGPFVMNSREELMLALQDLRNERFVWRDDPEWAARRRPGRHRPSRADGADRRGLGRSR